ncbi:zinc finger domain-containing protein [Brevibacterium litoralis]|uniref:zinc finger domain-containing protein n=1 Tax=Brevibacterium litoralis TaxID=3138935 RepID=UPI0032ECB45E
MTRLTIREGHKRIEWGYFARSLQADARAGSECFRCDAIMQKLVAAGRTSHYCSVCQKAPRRR